MYFSTFMSHPLGFHVKYAFDSWILLFMTSELTKEEKKIVKFMLGEIFWLLVVPRRCERKRNIVYSAGCEKRLT